MIATIFTYEDNSQVITRTEPGVTVNICQPTEIVSEQTAEVSDDALNEIASVLVTERVDVDTITGEISTMPENNFNQSETKSI